MFDASVLVRAGVSRSSAAREWTRRLHRDLTAFAPDLIWVEVANALRRGVTGRMLSAAAAQGVLATTLRLPIEVRPLAELARPSLDAALTHGITAYDASYLVLAEVLDATLVTADRRIADVAGRSELIA